ncbi:MAG TPA: 2-amino-4-hydroxy-6-hydroxymethyldihydropteridine diphosphokinase [Anseongella sp.]
MNEVYLSLGSNLGKRQENLAAASRELQNLLGTPLKQSSVYETAAWGNTDQSDFLNQVLVFQLEKGRENWLLERINELESMLGRVRREKWDARIIDIDILLAGSQVIHDSTLTIPHPCLHLRRFVLVPLNEIAPNLLHPEFDKTISELLEHCPDRLEVKRISVDLRNKRHS